MMCGWIQLLAAVCCVALIAGCAVGGHITTDGVQVRARGEMSVGMSIGSE